MEREVRVADLSEEELLAAFTPLLPRSDHEVVGNGDDCAVLSAPDGRYVVSTDVLVEGHHFRTHWSSGHDVGVRAAAQNLADAAAMGARPVALVVSLVLPPATPVSWVQDLARGLAQGCAPVGAGVVGGDLSAGESLVVAVTVHGDLEGRDPVLRSGARAGDLLVHSGTLGRSAAGYELLRTGWLAPSEDEAAGRTAEEGATGSNVSEAPGGRRAAVTLVPASRSATDAAQQCCALFRAPRPPLVQGSALAQAGASAMMDVSDSLLRDAGRLARASGVLIDLDEPTDQGSGLAVDLAFLEPVARLLETATPDAQVRARLTARRWVLTGGEDHGMLATVPAQVAQQLPLGTRVIGRVIGAGAGAGASAGTEGPRVTVGGRPWQGAEGWDHFIS